ncbi:MAG TPA: hypothetical protein VGO43_00115 [Pyrinomonadaceae bacterium]|nr:hypothetical protein [Pyrinomonadaceae bacterium]
MRNQLSGRASRAVISFAIACIALGSFLNFSEPVSAQQKDLRRDTARSGTDREGLFVSPLAPLANVTVSARNWDSGAGTSPNGSHTFTLTKQP